MNKMTGLTYLIIMFLAGTGVLLVLPLLISKSMGEIPTALLTAGVIIAIWGCIMYYNNRKA